MKNTIPYHIFKKNLQNHLVSINCYDGEWFETQQKRIELWWDRDETTNGAIKMIEIFARGHFDKSYHHKTSSLNPTICISYTEV